MKSKYLLIKKTLSYNPWINGKLKVVNVNEFLTCYCKIIFSTKAWIIRFVYTIMTYEITMVVLNSHSNNKLNYYDMDSGNITHLCQLITIYTNIT